MRTFILEHVETHPQQVTALAAKTFNLSRNAIAGYMKRLIKEGILSAEGHTRARHYAFKKIVNDVFQIKLSDGLPEDVVWRSRILPHLKDLPQNIIDICQYGFTEMLNNAIDHSASPEAMISCERTYKHIQFFIQDYGVGIFQKIQRDFNLPDPRSALLELSKGKLTSNPSKHAGEGIFFTSRMFDAFHIISGSLFYDRKRQNNEEWLIDSGDEVNFLQGTSVFMSISTSASWTWKGVFEQYYSDDFRFRKTHVPIEISKYPGEQLVSRSQAKRILARFENFSEVFLDFKGVETIGQAFADEIFRVYKLDHPDIEIIAVNISPEIEKMIAHVRGKAINPRS